MGLVGWGRDGWERGKEEEVGRRRRRVDGIWGCGFEFSFLGCALMGIG